MSSPIAVDPSIPNPAEKETVMRDARAGARVRPVAVLLLLMAAPVLATARTIEVMPGKSTSIAEVLQEAVAGDIVLVGYGTYDELMLVMPDGVTLVGTGAGPANVEIRAVGGYPLVLIEGAGPGTVIGNLTLTVADPENPAAMDRGTGATITDSSPTFADVIFRGFISGYGGAVHCDEQSQVDFERCAFEGNEALAAGGAVAAAGGSGLTFDSCLFQGNRSESTGGAINVALGSTAALTSCTLVDNEALLGGAIASFDAASVTIERTIVAGGLGGGTWVGDGYHPAAVTCSDLVNNVGGDWTGVLGPALGVDGNISADPQFCGSAISPRPYSLNSSSPCLAPASACGTMGAYGQECDVVVGVPGEDLPVTSRLYDAYPNPFNPATTVRYDLARPGHVEIAVFDLSGRLVRRLLSRTMTAGTHQVVWKGRDGRGRSAAAGVYFLRLRTEDTVDTKRMTLIK